MELSSVELLLTSSAILGNVALGIFTLIKNPKSATNIFFALFAFAVATYIGLNYLSLNQASDQTTFALVKMIMSVAAFVNLLFLLLATAYPDTELKINTWVLAGLVGFTFIVAMSAQLNLVFVSMERFAEGGFHTTPGPAMVLFLIQTLTFLIGAFVVLVRKYKRSETQQRNQIKMLFWGAVLMFSAILLTNVVFVVVFNNSNFVNLVPLYTLIFMGFVSYAIVRLGLFNTKLIATEAFVVGIWVILFARVIVAGDSQQPLDLIIFIAMVIFGILLMRTVRQEITQRQILSDLTKQLQVMDIKKSDFLNIVAHELRAPMTAIKGYVSMILEGDTGEISLDTKGYLEEVFSTNDRLIRLVNNLLNVSRIEEDRQVYNMVIVHLLEVVNINFNEHKMQAHEKRLKFELDTTLPLKSDTVYVDSDRIHEVVANFMSNAVKYTGAGSVTTKIFNPTSDRIRVEVSDTGIGIPADQQERIFQKYYRAQDTMTRTVGTGLGLYVSKLLVEKFGGTIGFTSVQGKGSTFWFELPLAKETSAKPNILV